MSKSVNFQVTAGLPFAKTIVTTLPSGRDWWTMSNQFEIRFEVRKEAKESSTMILNMSPYLTVVFDAPDTVTIFWAMTGKETRLLTQSGAYDIVMSDAGQDDARANVLLKGTIKRLELVTAKESTP